MKALKKLSFLNMRYKAEQTASALPALVLAAERAATSVLSGDHSQRKSGAGEKFWQYREYQTGDRPQDIDWRQSAKGDRLYVREQEWQTPQTLFLWCQHNSAMDYHSNPQLPTKQDHAALLTLALGILATRAGEKMAALESENLPGRSEKALQNLGEELLTSQTADLPRRDIRHIPKNSSIVLIGDFLADEQQCRKTFDALAGLTDSATLIQILDPAELTLPFEGRVIFERSAQDEQHHIENVESIRDAYKQRMHDHMEFLKSYCKKHRWSWVLHTTDEDPADTLFDVWGLLSSKTDFTGDSV